MTGPLNSVRRVQELESSAQAYNFDLPRRKTRWRRQEKCISKNTCKLRTLKRRIESARLYAVGPAGSRWQLNYLAKTSNSPLARSIACACNFAVKNIWSLFNYAM